MKFLLFLIAIASAQQQCLDSADTYINKRCFKLVNQPMSWQDARNWCHYRNPVTSSYLATVIDKTTANFLASIARTAFNINDGLFWIGLSRYNSSSRWQWDDGTPFVWSNFDANNNQNLNYAAESITNGKWVTKYGDEKYNFVCSYDPNAQPGTTGTPGTASWGTTVPIEQTTENDWTTTSDGPTPTAAESCTPNSRTSYLYAYSNDFSPALVNSIWEVFADSPMVSLKFINFVNVRFDTKTEGEFQYHNDRTDVAGSIKANLPDTSLGFGNSATGSDVFEMIDRFLDSTQVPICGSFLFILVKRYPNKTDTSRLVAKLRLYHSTISFLVVKDVPSGGSDPQALYDLATKTNGVCAFDLEEKLGAMEGSIPSCILPYFVYVVNPEVSGNGSIQLPPLTLPTADEYWVTLVYLDADPLNVVQSVYLKWNNTLGTFHYSRIGVVEPSLYGQTASYTSSWEVFDYTTFNMTLDYNYSDDKVRRLQIRVNGLNENQIYQWLPYDN